MVQDMGGGIKWKKINIRVYFRAKILEIVQHKKMSFHNDKGANS